MCVCVCGVCVCVCVCVCVLCVVCCVLCVCVLCLYMNMIMRFLKDNAKWYPFDVKSQLKTMCAMEHRVVVDSNL